MEEHSDTSHFSTDRPLVDPAEDKLDRDHISAEIARSLAAWKGRESLVVSLCGEWGSGKTTLKNFVVDHLKQTPNAASVVDFNPWQWSGQDKLLEGFLWQLGAEFGRKDIAKQTKKLAAKFKAFASVITFGKEFSDLTQKVTLAILSFSTVVSIVGAFLEAKAPWIKWFAFGALAILPCVSMVAGIIEKLSTALGDWSAFKELTLEELREDIEKELSKLKAPIIVFIDDVDRLTKDEIKLLFQLIKANVQFPNLVYFLLFQKNIVISALSEITSDEGDKYLRKIVQVEFDVPAASDKQMQSMLTEGLDRTINKKGVKIKWEQDRWRTIFLDDLWPYFKNLRDIKRFLGTFEFYFALHVNDGILEVNPVDLLAIELLRMFDHEAYISISKSFLNETNTMSGLLLRSKDITENFKEQISLITSRDSLSKVDQERLRHLLQFLFPQSSGSEAYESGLRNESKRQLRVCDESSFFKYFQISLDSTKPSAQEVSRFIELSDNRSRLVEMLRDAIQRNTMEELLDFLFVSKDDIPLDNMATVATALFDVGDDLREASKSMFSTGLDMQCNRIIYHRLKNENREASTEILWKAFVDTTGFILPIHKLSLEDKKTRERGAKSDFVISDERLPQFVDLTLTRIRAKAADMSLLDHKECGYVLYRWKEWAGDTEVRDWLSEVVKEPKRAVLLLAHLISKTIVNGVKEIPFLAGQAVETLISLNALDDSVKKMLNSQLSESDKINIGLLNKAVELKMEGRNYSEVRPDD